MAKELTESIEVHADDHHGHEKPSLITPEVNMVILTWVTFFLLLGVLYKYAWKPILDGLEQRENTIRKGIEDAEKSIIELEQINQKRDQIISEADDEAKRSIERGRKAAVEAAKVIENKAKEESQIILGNADHEIKAQKDKAQVELRQESVDLALGLTEKILDEKLDEAKHKKLIDKLIKDFDPGSIHE